MSTWDQEVTPDPERFPNIRARDEIIAGVARYRRAQGTAGESEAAGELAWDIRGHAYATYGRPMAYRHMGTVYGFREDEGPEGCDELTLFVMGPGDLDGHPPGFEVVDIPDDATYTMN